jgi:hypothetical protein
MHDERGRAAQIGVVRTAKPRRAGVERGALEVPRAVVVARAAEVPRLAARQISSYGRRAAWWRCEVGAVATGGGVAHRQQLLGTARGQFDLAVVRRDGVVAGWTRFGDKRAR